MHSQRPPHPPAQTLDWRYLTGCLIALLVAVSVLPAQAQYPRHHRMMMSDSTARPAMMGYMGTMSSMPMMQSMHQQMMQSPMHRAGMTAFMLPTLADTLGLTDEQASRLQELKSALMAQHRANQQAVVSAREDLHALFDEGEPAPSAVREQLQTLSDLHTAWQAAVYETAHAMRQTLDDEQRDMLDSMTPQQHMHQVMTHMSMRDVMQMMHAVHGRGMMLGMGMMNSQGMMNQGMMNQNGRNERPMTPPEQNR